MSIDFKLSEHCTKDRLNRLTFIMMNTGLGEVFCEYQQSEYILYRLTTTGVLLVIDPRWMVLVSAYYVNMNKATAIMKLSNTTAPRSAMYKTLRANKKFISEQDKISY